MKPQTSTTKQDLQRNSNHLILGAKKRVKQAIKKNCGKELKYDQNIRTIYQKEGGWCVIKNTERCLYNNTDASYNQKSFDHFFVLYNYSLRKK